MKKTALLALIPLLLSAIPLSSCGQGDVFRPQEEIEREGYRKIDFSWQVGDKETGYDYFYYKDEFFGEKASSLNLSFARVGYAWAISNFAAYTYTGDYTRQYVNAQDLVGKIGFDNFEVNDDFKEKPSIYTIGLSCAKKTLNLGGNECTALMVGIRGAGYEAEWGSNFTLGEKDNHPGFEAAANNATNFVHDYIAKRNISGDIKILVSGYSRAAATTNLFAGMLDNALQSGVKPLGQTVSYGKDDIFAYCFEPPAGVSREQYNLQSDTYSNIHCFINPNDMVPLVAPVEYGFGRYGNQYYYPGPTSDPNYSVNKEKMLQFLNEMLKTGHKKYGGYAIDGFIPHAPDDKGSFFGQDDKKLNWTVELYVRRLISTLANQGLLSRQNFFDKIQSGLINTIALVYENGSVGGEKPFNLFTSALIKELLNLKLSKSLIDDLTIEELHPYFATDFTPFLIRAFHSFMPDLALEVIQEIASGLSGLFVGFAEVAFSEPALFASLIDMHNINALTHAHYPEINYFWLKAMDPLIYKEPVPAQFALSWSYLSLNNVDNVEVYDESNKLVMQIKDGKPINFNNGYSYGSRTIRKELFYDFYFPGEQSFTVKAHINEPNFTCWSCTYFDPASATEKFSQSWSPKPTEDESVYKITITKLY